MLEIASENRKFYLDISRCILIFLVVLGHTDKLPQNIANIIYWVHMPAFFILSGMVSKFDSNENTISKIKKMAFSYLIPYVFYYLIISVITKSISIQDFAKYIYGGRMYTGVYWFIICLFLTTILFSILHYHIQKKYVIVIIILFYVLAHIESVFYLPNNNDYLNWNIIYKIPFSADTCLFSLFYYAVGFYLKDIVERIINNHKIRNLLIISALCILFIALNQLGIIEYRLNMKLGYYRNLILDAIIPVLFTLLILLISSCIYRICKCKPLIYIGQNTLPIMYLHIPINAVLQNKLHYGILGYVFIGIVIPLIFAFICSKNKVLKLLFLGRRKSL